MKKYIPWIIVGIFILSIGLTAYIIFGSQDVEETESSSNSELAKITPNNMKIEDITDNSFTITWETEEEATGYVKYGNTSNSLSLIAQDRNGTNPLKKHEVKVSGLVSGRKYYFYVMSDNVAFGREGRALEVLTTSGL